jgi:hypothetical protein
MSMMGEFREITPALLRRLKREPSLTRAVVLADIVDDPARSDFDTLLQAMPPAQRDAMRTLLDSMPPEKRAQMEAQAAGASAALRGVAKEVHGDGPGQRIPPEDLGERISIDKAWHGLHFLLTGSAEPTSGDESQVVMGGAEIGEDGGYGPARYLEAEDVLRVAAVLQALTPDELRLRYDASAMEEISIYPGGWDDEENLEWLLEAFSELSAFYKGTAARGNAVLLYLT